jgi:hypothetical protein
VQLLATVEVEEEDVVVDKLPVETYIGRKAKYSFIAYRYIPWA